MPLAAFALAALLAAPVPRAELPLAPPQPGPGLSLTLNLPAFRLEVREGGELVRTYVVAPGSPRYRTPIGSFHVYSVELNPWWHPPKSWWARKEKVTPPGPSNPMGRAKLNFGELYFLHGTPQVGSLGSAASHGCVRMRNDDAVELARRVMAEARPDVGESEIDLVLSDRSRTRRYELSPGIPLEVQYRTAEVRDGALELHPDVYGRERAPLRARAIQALADAGISPLEVNAARLDSAVRAARRHHARVPLPALLVAAGLTVSPAPGTAAVASPSRDRPGSPAVVPSSEGGRASAGGC